MSHRGIVNYSTPLEKLSLAKRPFTRQVIRAGVSSEYGVRNLLNRSNRYEFLHSKALPPFAALRAFEAVFRLGGIRKGAASLNLNHAVVSRHIRLLEDWVGTSLLTREAHRLVLTDEGVRFHSRVSAAISEIALATRDLLDEKAQNQLRLSCSPGLAIQWLSGQLAEFERDYPEFVVEMKPTDIAPNLLVHETDVDVRYFGDDWAPSPGAKGLRFVELARPELIAVANPVVANRLNKLKSVAELKDAPLLHEEHDKQWRNWFLKNGVSVVDTLPGPLFWHAHLALNAAKLGRGVALGNPYLVSKDLAKGDLVEVHIPGTKRAVTGAYVLVAREDRWSVPALKALRKFLQLKARQQPDGAVCGSP